MQPMTLREVVEDWLQSLDMEATAQRRNKKLALLAELAKAEAAVDLAEFFARGWREPSSQMRKSTLPECRLSCRYWDAKQAAAKFQSNQ